MGTEFTVNAKDVQRDIDELVLLALDSSEMGTIKLLLRTVQDLTELRDYLKQQ